VTRPTDAGLAAEGLYEDVEPLTFADEENDWALLILLGGIGHMVQTLYDLVMDTDDYPGWSSLLDVERCPFEFLGYLGQFVGVAIPVGTPEEEARQLVREHAGTSRGTPDSMTAAIEKTLTGTQTVNIVERSGDSAYQLLVRTLTAETPDSDATLAAIISQKPGGIILSYEVGDFTLIDELIGNINSQTGSTDGL
jgi:hypothetical protein